jgi:hypothetical protein
MIRGEIMALPPFNSEGHLPAGIHLSTFADLRASHLVLCPSASQFPDWDAGWRSKLVDNLEMLVKQLWSYGCDEVFIDGSFVDAIEHPGDIDGYFNCEVDDLKDYQMQNALNTEENNFVWNWHSNSFLPAQGYPRGKPRMWHFYRVELIANITDPHPPFSRPGNMRENFRFSDRTGKERGLVQIQHERRVL